MDEKPECPKCNSKNTRKNGFSRNGTQLYRCFNCDKRFQIDFFNNKSRERQEEMQDRVEDFQNKVFPIKQARPLPSTDSINGVPCFSCGLNHCDPTTCSRLDEWLELYRFPLMVRA
jgi:hypothetical protein